MKHNICLNGLGYRIRPVDVDDAEFIVKVRLEDAERNRFIHKISPVSELQKQWICKYYERDDDYYFVLENKLTGLAEGLIGIYDIKDGKAEWGRWVLQKGSMGAIESLDLICQAAFDCLHLTEIYSHTIESNMSVVSFHNSVKEKFRQILPDFLEMDGKTYNAVEHYVDADYYQNEFRFSLQIKAQKIFERNLKMAIGSFEFHHIGVACSDFEKEASAYKMLGYRQESPDFRDDNQGIFGRFLVANNQPRIELLKNTENSHTLDIWLKNKTKMYHTAYTVQNFDKALDLFLRIGAKGIRPAMSSIHFGKRICFLMLPNMGMIELIEG